MLQSHLNRQAEAEKSLQQAVKLQDALLAARPSDVQALSNQGSTWNNLAMLFDGQHRQAIAAEAYKKAIRFQRKAIDVAPTNGDVRSALSRHYFNYAKNLSGQRKYQDALRVIDERRQLWVHDPDRLFTVGVELAGLLRELNRQTGGAAAKQVCVQLAAETLREALAAGLPRERLSDPSLSGLNDTVEFQRAMDESRVGLAPAVLGAHADSERMN
jgi:tetratricopeptide (TPR) repeat protein